MTDPIARLRGLMERSTQTSDHWRHYLNNADMWDQDRDLVCAMHEALPALLNVASAMQEIADTCAFHSGAGYKGIHEVATRALKRLAERGET